MGGRREGAGRKPVNYWHKMKVGGFCEECFREIQEEERWARVEARPDTQAKRRHQREVQKIGASLRRALRNMPIEAAEKLLNRHIGKQQRAITNFGRVGTAPTRRPKGIRTAILKKAAQKFDITKDQADGKKSNVSR
jgi:hypothetical protein